MGTGINLANLLGILTVLLYGTQSGESLSQQQLDNIAKQLSIRARVVDNLERNGVTHDVIIELTNQGTESIPEVGWKLYFHSMYLLFGDIFPEKKSKFLDDVKMNVSMIQGDLYAMEPVIGFGDLAPQQSVKVNITVQNWSVSRTDFMPLWYLASEGLVARVVKTTAPLDLEYVEPFSDVTQWKRYRDDLYNPFTAQARYRRLGFDDSLTSALPVIPTPMSIEIPSEGPTVEFQNIKTVFADPGLTNELNYLQDEYDITVISSEDRNQLRLQISDLTMKTEGYQISMKPSDNVITITGQDSAGVFYGIQTLIGIKQNYQDGNMPNISVRDEPRFGFRGMHVDVARNFHTVEDMRQLLGAMAMYKLNKLHWHLSDDEGWRLDIPGLPELTQVGGQRCHDLSEQRCIIPQFGSGPYSNSSGSGFYSIQDYQTLLRLANSYHIEVIPEFDMPGHAHAAIKSMERRYKRILEETGNESLANEFRLSDPDDRSMYLSVQQWQDNAINPCLESTYNFISHVVKAVKDIHRDIQPLKVYHFGGDEVANGAWNESPKCKEFLTQHTFYNVSKGLKQYFAERVANITAYHDLELRGWEDVFMDKDGNPFSLERMGNPRVSANPWDNIWEWGVSQRAYRFANAGYKVVMSQGTHLYFDHPYEPDPEERGLYWASRFTDTKKVFSFLPDSLYDNIEVKRSGQPLTRADVCSEDDSKCDKLEKPENIIGMQGHLWTETVRTNGNFHSMIFPRLLALAERAWHKAEFEEEGITKEERHEEMEKAWQRFAKRLGNVELRRLEERNITYRVPPPGGYMKDGILIPTTTFPGLKIEFKTPGDRDFSSVPEEGIPLQEDDMVYLRTRSVAGRYSRVVEFFTVEENIVEYIGQKLIVKLDVISNTEKIDGDIRVNLTLANSGQRDIVPGSWRIYLYSLTGLRPGFTDCNLEVQNENGFLYYLSPIEGAFKGIAHAQSISCTIYVRHWMIARTDNLPNWYVTSPTMTSVVIASTVGEDLKYVGDFDTPEKWKKTINDTYNPYSASDRYNLYKTDGVSLGEYHVIPTPRDVTIGSNAHLVFKRNEWRVYQSTDFPNEAKILADHLNVPLEPSSSPSQQIIFVKSDSIASPEGYQLNINPQTEVIRIISSTSAGAFYGLQSLISLIEAHDGKLSSIIINDEPRFGYRGIMVDVARNFRSKATIFKLIDAMSTYKLNRLHLHLTDDEGWRLEIPGIPELTEIGSKRCQDDSNDRCLIPILGSGPDENTSGSGFYTVSDYQEILRYAASRHVVVIPEVDMPGHSRAAIKAMSVREEKIKETGGQSYLLSDAVQPVAVSVQGWRENAINPCLETSYTFAEKVLDEIINMHRDIQPLKIFNFGGDEVPLGAWDGSPACNNKYPDLSESQYSDVLKKMFVQRVIAIINQKGLQSAAWEDGLMQSDGQPFPRKQSQSDTYAIAWNNIWEDGLGKRAYELANVGHKVIFAMATHLYYDHPYEPDPEERGLYWATRFIDTRKTFGFIPNDVFANVDVDKLGNQLNKDAICHEHGCPELIKPENVVGMQACLWGETLRTDEQFEYMTFPRLLALAERAWHEAPWEREKDKLKRDNLRKVDWEKFSVVVGNKEFPRLEKRNILHRVPPPGAILVDGKVRVNTLYPGLTVEISRNRGESWVAVLNSFEPGTGHNEIWLRSRSRVLARTSRTVKLFTDLTAGSSQSTSVNCVVILWSVLTVFLTVM